GPGSLRQAILNANAHTGTDTITFAIGGGGGQIIAPTSALPTITHPVVIDGTTPPGHARTPPLVLSGADARTHAPALTISAGYSTVKGLVINAFQGSGIVLQDKGGNFIVANYIGTDQTGTKALGNNGSGIDIATGSNNTVGGTAAGARNLISGNGYLS